MGDQNRDPLRPGAFWMELSTWRRIRIISPFEHHVGPLWTYVDSLGEPVPDSERYPDCYKHCSDIFDFSVFGKFVCEDDLLLRDLRPSDVVELTDEQLQEFRPVGRAILEVVAASRRRYRTGWVPFPKEDLKVTPVLLGLLLRCGCVVYRTDNMMRAAEPLIDMLIQAGAVYR